MRVALEPFVLELREEGPRLFGDPVRAASRITGDVCMAAVERANLGRIFRFAPRDVVTDMGA